MLPKALRLLQDPEGIKKTTTFSKQLAFIKKKKKSIAFSSSAPPELHVHTRYVDNLHAHREILRTAVWVDKKSEGLLVTERWFSA